MQDQNPWVLRPTRFPALFNFTDFRWLIGLFYCSDIPISRLNRNIVYATTAKRVYGCYFVLIYSRWQAELNEEIEEMERAKETKSGRPKSANSNVSSDDSDDDEGSTGGLSARAGSAIARPSAGGGGVSYEEFNV